MTCSVCNEEEETAEHIIWRCKPLDKRRKEADSILKGIKCELLPAPNQAWHCTCPQGNYPGNVLGYHGRGVASGSTIRCGCDERDGKHLPDTFKGMPSQLTARECMQGATARSDDMTKLPLPPKVQGVPPEDPN